ncbi:MAG: CoB--CoM heterodisulfide reductase iron-sulfur subunit B family protein [Deltaproteobacteria bacterium]|nr:CoB--CoM heterodisulfide reductase iron-sulfur subunit B family protein [Deltaproteobacteria bacterium]MBW2120433.1 CoB--CoM heterodisulfide reductase iron-sulfur subunit B family protein [Deltaproteobacteria bacterium]
MAYAYFPGCMLKGSAQDYDISFRWVCRFLGIELQEVRDWVCCGGASARAISRLLSVVMPAMSLAGARQQGLDRLVAPCLVALSRMKAANLALQREDDLARRVGEVLGESYEGTVEVLHPLEILLEEVGLDSLAGNVRKRLPGLKIVCYYGCNLARPPRDSGFDDPEYPMSMDRILGSVGLETLDWAYKTECCGASMTYTRPEVVRHLSHEILRAAKQVGAEMIAVCCPLCQANLDMRQNQIAEIYGERFDIPVLYFTQILGIVFGAYSGELGLGRLMVSPQRALENYGIL